MSADMMLGSIDAPQSLNRYSYTMNDPVNLTDHMGLSWECHYEQVNVVVNGERQEGELKLVCVLVDDPPLDSGFGVGGGGLPGDPCFGGPCGGGGTGGGGGPEQKPDLCPADKRRFFNWLNDALGKMASDLNTTKSLMFTMAAKEGGWTEDSLDHNQPLNNPFGVNSINRKGQAAGNIAYPSLQSAVDYWKDKYGGRVGGTQTPDDFVNGLQHPKQGRPYNSADPKYESKFSAIYKAVQKFMAICGIK
jgi:hypothetical protein